MLRLQQERDDRVSVIMMMTRIGLLLLHITYSQCCISITPYILYSFYQPVYSLHGVEVQILHSAMLSPWRSQHGVAIIGGHDPRAQSSAVTTLGRDRVQSQHWVTIECNRNPGSYSILEYGRDTGL
jgi:hypothetical protein